MLVSLIPLSVISGGLFYSLLELQGQISNIYHGAVEILVGVTEGSDILLELRGNTFKHVLATTPEDKQRLEEQVRAEEGALLQILLDYRKIEDFPMQIPMLRERGLESLIPYENALLADTHINLREFRSEKDRTLALSNEGRTEEALLQWSGPAGERLDMLRSNYKALIDLNSQLALIMYEESQAVAQRAFAWGMVAFVATSGAAVAGAVFFSKKLSPPLEEVEKKARRELEKFIVETSIVQQKATKNGSEQPEQESRAFETGSESSSDLSASYGPVILVQSAGYYQGSHDKLKDESARQLDAVLEKFQAAEEKSKLVVMTRKGSNLYHKARNNQSVVYVLSSSIQNPLETSEEGILTISINQTSLILEVIKKTLQENPSATIIIDSATELIHRLGFEKVFALVQNISDLASSFPQSHVLILINRNAHEANVVEAIASIANVFLRE